MRGVMAVVRVLLVAVVIGLIANCAGDPTAPERGVANQPAFATASDGNGLSITTDKDDYTPGDTVWFTGAGWTPGDSLDIVLNDSVDVHNWSVGIDENGAFRDSTYVVDTGDLGVTFTLTATSRTNPEQTLTVTFTDGSLSLAAPTKPTPSSQNFPVPNPFPVAGVTFTAANSSSPAGAHTNVVVRIRNAGNGPSFPTLQRELSVTASLAAGSQASVVWDGNNASATPLVEGLYGVRAVSTQRGEPNNSDINILVDRTSPSISSPAVTPSSVVQGSNTAVTLTGTATDAIVSGVNANNYNVVSAKYRRDGLPATEAAMSAVDGNFNGQIENLTVTIPGGTVAALGAGNHVFCMQATDASGNAGAFTITGNPNCATLEITSVDAQAPTIDCSPVPDQTKWYDANVPVNCTASDGGSGLKNPSDANFSLKTSVAAGAETASAQTNTHQVCDNNNNCDTAGPYTFKVDLKDPTYSCDAADALWHADDVSISCTAADGGSGIDPASDVSFSLNTSVPGNTETANASTGTKVISDLVGHTVTAGPITNIMVDKKAPTYLCGSADGVWHPDNVSISCTASDGGSGLNPATDANFLLSTTVLAGNQTGNASTGTKSLADQVGNSTTAGPISGNKIDRKGPTVTLVCPSAPVILGSTAYAPWTADDGPSTDGSGVVAGHESGSFLLATGTVGTHTQNAAAGTSVDNVNNNSPATSCDYSVIYLWTGFFQPVDNNELNIAKAGSGIPVKFNLGGNQGLNIFSSGYPLSKSITCDPYAGTDAIETTVNAGNSSLTYDETAQQYIYVWKSDKAWAGTCRRLVIKLNDGTTHTADFKWTKF